MKIIIFECILLMYVTESVKIDMELVLTKNDVIPDIIDVAPHKVMEIRYPNGYYVKAGDVMKTIDVTEKPLVYWKADVTRKKYYTLIMFSPDYPKRSNPIFGGFLHWMVVNIPGNRVEEGETICDYLGALPEPPERLSANDLDRYIFLVYKQKAKTNYGGEERIYFDDFLARQHFSIRKFVSKYLLNDPVAGNIFLAQFDQYAASMKETFLE